MHEWIDRLLYKPRYRFRFTSSAWGSGELAITTDEMIPDAEHTSDFPDIPDEWLDPQFHATTERKFFIGCLQNALACAVHEVLEWYSVDGRRLIKAHDPAVTDHVYRETARIAAWVWRQRKRHPGDPYPKKWIAPKGGDHDESGTGSVEHRRAPRRDEPVQR